MGYENNIGTLKLSGVLLRSLHAGREIGEPRAFRFCVSFLLFVFSFLRIIEPGLLGSSMQRAGP